MVSVNRNYKLINLEIDGEERTEEIDTKEAWSVMEVEVDGQNFTVNEGDEIEFLIESGEVVSCVVNKMTGKGAKTNLQIKRFGSMCEEIWSVSTMVKLRLIKPTDIKPIVENEKDEE
jgi:hypothetical protein